MRFDQRHTVRAAPQELHPDRTMPPPRARNTFRGTMHLGLRPTARWVERTLPPAIERGSAWIERQDPMTRRGATIGWFQLYRRADGQLYAMLLTSYIFITALPATVALATFVYNNPTRLADRLVARLHLDPSTSSLVHTVLSGASKHQLVATIIAVGDVVIFGSGFGRTLQLIYARVWHVDVTWSRLRDQERYLAVLAVLVGLMAVFLLETSRVSDGSALWLATMPLWLFALIAYFAWLPRYLLHRQIPIADILPGAAFAALGLVALRLASSLVLARWLKSYAKNFGAFGIILALFFWLLVIASLIVMSAALAPPFAGRRASRKPPQPGISRRKRMGATPRQTVAPRDKP
jgi:uncharacterized BrkB/YihY/UPF0761 family membrane protein